MQPTPLPPNPYLLGILLVIQSRTGPRFVFHYPPKPSVHQDSIKRHSSSYTAHGTNTSPSDDSESSSSDDTAWNSDADENHRGGIGTRISSNKRHDAATGGGSTTGRRSKAIRGNTLDDEELLSDTSDEDGIRTKTGRNDAEARHREMADWESVLGYSTDGLQKLLCPPKTFHKKRFEVCLDGLVFLGCPIFVREDGLWKKDKRHKTHSEQHDGRNPHNLQAGADEETRPDEKASAKEGSTDGQWHHERSQELSEDAAKISSPYSAPTFGVEASKNLGASKDPGSKPKSVKESKMTMFHVVFVMNPPALEYHVRLDDMYRNVAREFAKILKVEQAQSFYVWSQSKAIVRLKQRAKDEESIANVYNTVSASKIAHLKLSSPIEIPLQIPQPSSTSQVSTPMTPQLPGLWLTTTNVIESDSRGIISPHMGVLLLQDADTILKDLAREEQELSAALIYFVRNLIPTKSLLKLSKIMRLSLQELQYLSGHLISGRRARAVPPLHPRDTYIVSPNADMRQLSAATEAFTLRFPTFPSLPKMLTMLSGTPKTYGMLMPSKDHRPAYVEILAWLMRGGWVTQLRTFAWVRLAPEIQHRAYLKVLQTQAEREANAARGAEEDSQRARLRQYRQKSSEHVIPRTETRASSDSGRRLVDDGGRNDLSPRSMPLPVTPPDQHSPARSPAQTPTSPMIHPAPEPDLLSPTLSVLRPPSRPTSATGSISSVRTAVHNPPRTDSPSAVPAPRSPFLSSHSPSFAPSPSTPPYPPTDPQHYLSLWPVPDVADLAPLLAYDTRDATTKQFFDAALALLGEDLAKEDEEMGRMWPRFVKHFDGSSALEEISVREGLKRARIQAMLGKIRDEGHLCIVRHW
ncbi:MAG: Nitrogen permease regulator 3 [Bathelium mastoideum]|nr:MAG: Nitrogen permease regulator 3 [Bathelium mastoideum]